MEQFLVLAVDERLLLSDHLVVLWVSQPGVLWWLLLLALDAQAEVPLDLL